MLHLDHCLLSIQKHPVFNKETSSDLLKRAYGNFNWRQSSAAEGQFHERELNHDPDGPFMIPFRSVSSSSLALSIQAQNPASVFIWKSGRACLLAACARQQSKTARRVSRIMHRVSLSRSRLGGSSRDRVSLLITRLCMRPRTNLSARGRPRSASARSAVFVPAVARNATYLFCPRSLFGLCVRATPPPLRDSANMCSHLTAWTQRSDAKKVPFTSSVTFLPL